jgi:glycerol-3-phosphate acyltransferase PlsY
MNELLLILIAYLIGSIPTAVWVSKRFFNIDIRDYGSGSAGATNVYRILGSRWGTFVMLIDMLKGGLAVQLAWLLPEYIDSENQFQNLQTVLGMAAVLGHIFPVWAEFKGGKGVATVFGMVLGISPITAVSCAGVFMLVLYYKKLLEKK